MGERPVVPGLAGNEVGSQDGWRNGLGDPCRAAIVSSGWKQGKRTML